MTIFYAGIGARLTPPYIIAQMELIGTMAALAGFTLRSGAADGADSAFESGALVVNGPCEIFLPWPMYNGHLSVLTTGCKTSTAIACHFHPMGENMKDSHKRLHGRNAYQILGQDLATPSEFVAAYTPDGCEHHHTRTSRTGGTGTAISIASMCDIPVYNLAKPGRFKQVVDIILSQVV
jgi:hypothetical protein